MGKDIAIRFDVDTSGEHVEPLDVAEYLMSLYDKYGADAPFVLAAEHLEADWED